MIKACKETFSSFDRDLRDKYLEAVEQSKANNEEEDAMFLLDFRRKLHLRLYNNVQHKEPQLYR